MVDFIDGTQGGLKTIAASGDGWSCISKPMTAFGDEGP